MMNLEDLKDIKRVKNTDWVRGTKGLSIVVTNMNSAVTIFLYNFFYRIEFITVGGKKPTVYLIDDQKKVKRNEVILGYFIEDDIGKNKAEVIQERYTSTFTTTIVIIRDYRRFRDQVKKWSDNILILGVGKNFSKGNELFKDKLEDNKRSNRNGGLARVHGTTDNDEVKIYTTVSFKDGDLMGESEIDNIEKDRKTAHQIIYGNQLVGNMMLMVLNLIVVNDKDIKGSAYHKLTINMETGEQKVDYFKRKETIFHERKVYRYLVSPYLDREEIEELDQIFKEELEKRQGILEVKGLLNREFYEEMLEHEIGKWINIITQVTSKLENKKLLKYELDIYKKALLFSGLLRMSHEDSKEQVIVLNLIEREFKPTDFI